MVLICISIQIELFSLSVISYQDLKVSCLLILSAVAFMRKLTQSGKRFVLTILVLFRYVLKS